MVDKKTIAIVSFLFPPNAKAGAHRAFLMAEFLPSFGWDPVFIAPAGAEYYGRDRRVDYNLLPVVEQFPVYRIPLRIPYQNGKTHLLARSVRRAAEAVLIPDSRIIWNIEIKKALDEIVARHSPKIIFITGIPFSSFLLAPYIKKHYSIPVVLDYRDPWSGNPTMENTRIRRMTNERYEKVALSAASMVTSASYYIAEFVRKKYGADNKHIDFCGFPYGYNSYFYDRIRNASVTQSRDEIIGTFAGYVHGEHNVDVILSGIRNVVSKWSEISDKALKIKCHGTLFGYGVNVRGKIESFGLEAVVDCGDFLPYEDFARKLVESDFLIMPHGQSDLARMLYPTKLFDYLGARKPILYVGGIGQVWNTIENCMAGICVPPEASAIARGIEEIVSRPVSSWYQDSRVEQFSRRNIIKNVCSRFDELVARN